MKVLILILISFLSVYSTVQAKAPVSDAALFVDGFLRGSLAQDIGRVDNCLTDGDKIISEVTRIITDTKGKFDLLSLITDIGSILTDIPNSMRDCTDLLPTVKSTFDGWAKKIKNPLTIAGIVLKALTKHRTDLEGDFSNFLSSWKSGSLEASGQSLGDIPHILFDLCEPTPKIPVDAIPLFIDGFLRSALDKEIGRVDDCLLDGDKLALDIEGILTDLQGGFNLLNIIGDIGALLTDIPNSIRDCGEIKDTVTDVVNSWVKEIKNPLTIAKIVYTALKNYKERLTGDASEFVDLWKSDQFETSGQKLGDIPHVLFDMCSLPEATVQMLMKSN